LKLLTGSGPGLDRFDLSFPEVRNYLPPPHGEQGDNWHGIGNGGAPSPAEQHPAQLHDIVVLAIIDFDFRFQRPQQIAAEYARRGHRVFWLSPTRFLSPASAQPYSTREIRRNIWEVHLRGEQPDIYLGELSADACAQLRKSIKALYRDWAISESCTLVQLPFWRRLSLALREDHGARIVYDCMDEWDSFENMGRFNVDEEKALAQECDVLVVTAAKLEQKFRARALAPVLVRNAADFDFFQSGGISPLLEGIPKPIVGYFGAIADWIDLDLIREVARLRPQYSFVLVGQVFGRNVTELEALPNVHLLGNQPYDQIPPLLRGFDVCQIPFLRNQVTEATDPVKLYEYLSLGKPVVATDMAELRYCAELIYTANDAPGFAGRLDAALGETDPAAAIRRIEFARKNSWAARVEGLENAVRGVFPLVSILIVTYNSEEYIGPCLRSIQKNTSYPRVEVIVVDNASCDGTAAAVRQIAAADGRIRFLQLKTNTGFAAGNNAAAAGAQGEFLILLNADTLVTPGWVGRLLRHLTRDASAGIVCAATNFAGNEAKVNIDYQHQEGMERFAIRLARDRRDRALEVPVVPLFCAMLRRSIFERVGCLDTRYGIGMFEDDDLSTAIRRQGLRAIVAEDCFVHHFGQGSFAKLSPGEYERLFQENRRRFEAKWETEWIPHRPRPNVRPAHEERRFSPLEFLS
ncbi:MAG: glycosyltransferase, partial [Bryobacterales bacterium]|nr:glycosyltransferase [Bryobacterales bacterium]